MGEDCGEPDFVPLDHSEIEEGEMLSRANSLYSQMKSRRTTRHFSSREVSRELIELAIKTASTAPSGAHLQPWTFVAISDYTLKSKIRQAAEEEERRFYEERIPEAWQEVLAPLGTDHVKESFQTLTEKKAQWRDVSYLLLPRVMWNCCWHIHLSHSQHGFGYIDTYPLSDGLSPRDFGKART